MPRMQIDLPDDWLAVIDKRVAKQASNRTDWLRSAIRAALPKGVAAKLSEPARPGRRWPGK